jgi:hypothetical protein
MSHITLRRADAEQIRNFMRDCDEAEPLPHEERTALAALDAALKEPEQKPEPVAYFDPQNRKFYWARLTEIDVPTVTVVPPLPLYAAPPEPDAAPPKPVHPGYVIGSHWLETAYSRIAAGEAEDAVLAEVLGERGWAKREPATEKDVDIEFCEITLTSFPINSRIDFRAGFRAAERFHGIRKEGA